jgi:ADP-heptose:LPS heptosyltransferase
MILALLHLVNLKNKTAPLGVDLHCGLFWRKCLRMFCTDAVSMTRQLPRFLMRCFNRRRSVTFLHHREALGDTLMLSALARGLKKVRPDIHIAVVCRRPELFFNNPNIDENRGWHLWRSGCTVGAKYNAKDLAGPLHAVEIQWRSLWRELAAAQFIGVKEGEVPPLDGLYPELFLSADESSAADATLKKSRPKPVVLIGSGGKLKPTHNREWGLANYQAVADALCPHAAVFQISGEEPLRARGEALPDLRNIPVREAAALFASCDAMLVQEGGLMHVARAVNAPCVSIYGGYVLPYQTGYHEQTNFFRQPDCSPCIPTLKNCFHLKCMTTITPRAVLQALVKNIRARSGVEIPREVVESVPDEWTPPPFVDLKLLEKELASVGRAASPSRL